ITSLTYAKLGRAPASGFTVHGNQPGTGIPTPTPCTGRDVVTSQCLCRFCEFQVVTLVVTCRAGVVTANSAEGNSFFFRVLRVFPGPYETNSGLPSGDPCNLYRNCSDCPDPF